MKLDAYLAGEETNRPSELVFGVLREPAAPSFRHQIVVGQVYLRLERHVRRHALGRVVQSPIDVILDPERALVVQPDVVLVSTARLQICREQIWGPPDLVVEVLSTATQRHDRIVKLAWFRRYGVRECWLVDPVAASIDVVDLTVGGDAAAATTDTVVAEGARVVRSAVLPGLRLRATDLFI